MCYEHRICTTGFSKDSTTLQHWDVTTFGIAGLQGNSIIPHTQLLGHTNIANDNFGLFIFPGHFMHNF